MGNPVVYYEICVKDGVKGREFYSKMFDWDIKAQPTGNYGEVQAAEGGIVGGIMEAIEGKYPPYVTIYVQVDDIPKYLEKVKELGGTVLVPETEIPGMGTFGMFNDLDGNMVGLWSRGK